MRKPYERLPRLLSVEVAGDEPVVSLRFSGFNQMQRWLEAYRAIEKAIRSGPPKQSSRRKIFADRKDPDYSNNRVVYVPSDGREA